MVMCLQCSSPEVVLVSAVRAPKVPPDHGFVLVTRSEGFALSLKHRKWIEEAFG
jgi:hypothetical protein